MTNEQTGGKFLVLINEEEQYSLWPAQRAIPSGWRQDGASASREECLARIEEAWTDMRPRSLREAHGNS